MQVEAHVGLLGLWGGVSMVESIQYALGPTCCPPPRSLKDRKNRLQSRMVCWGKFAIYSAALVKEVRLGTPQGAKWGPHSVP